MLYVVGNQSDLGRFRCLKKGAACEKAATNKKESGQEMEHTVIIHFGALV